MAKGKPDLLGGAAKGAETVAVLAGAAGLVATGNIPGAVISVGAYLLKHGTAARSAEARAVRDAALDVKIEELRKERDKDRAAVERRFEELHESLECMRDQLGH